MKFVLPLLAWLCVAAFCQTPAELQQTAQAHFQQGKFEAALNAVEAALKFNPEYAPALTLKARLALAANRNDIAIATLRHAVALEPVASNQFLLGFALYLENEFTLALPSLTEAARLQPKDARTQLYLAMTFEGLSRHDEARAAYERALLTEGAQLTDALVAYARFLFAQGRYDASEKLIDRALTIENDSRDAHYEKGRLCLERRAYADAVKYGKQALSLAGAGATERQIHYLLARAYAQTGPKERADFHLAKFRAAPPTLRR
jgi:tetratricopeptide (TPR) repeat protein